MSSVKQVQSVLNACAVVEAIAAHQPIGVTELARVTGLDKSGVHRIAVTLQQARWLQPTPDARWQLAPAFGRLARRASRDSLLGVIGPTLEALRDDTGETILLAVADGARLVVEAVLESPHPVRMSTRVGAELPMVGSAAARAIAAHLPADERAALRVAHPELDGDRALEAVRRRGWAANEGEVVHDASAVASPVLSADGYPLAAVVVCGPTTRFSAARLKELGELVGATVARGSGRA